MKRVCLTAALMLCTAAHAGEGWSALWHTPDQRGQALLNAGDAAAAARTFADPHRKAFAEMKAGQYQAAAKDYTALSDRDAHYNRGNALAHAGQLQQALQAYDAALKLDPHDRDAQRNRDLVAKALEQQKQQQQQQKQQQNQQGSGQPKQSQGQQPSPGQSGAQQASAPQAPAQPGQQGQDKDQGAKQPDGKQPDAQQQGHQQAPKQQSGHGQSGKTGDQPSAPKPQAASSPSPSSPSASAPQPLQAGANAQPSAMQNNAEQARRDVAAGLDKAAAASAPGNGNPLTPTPRSEQQLAKDQWLRSIPDDPSGLLRRKFMLQHMLRQENTK